MFLQSDSTIISGWISFGGALLGALMGGLFAFLATVYSLKKSQTNNLAIQEQSNRATIRGVLLGIKTEIEANVKGYIEETKEFWATYSEGKPFLFIYDVTQNYFIVFDSNAYILGQIEDDDLRESIIVAYLNAKGLIDSHLLQNKKIREFEKFSLEHLERGHPTAEVNRINADILQTSRSLKYAFDQTKSSVDILLKKINSSNLILK